MQEKPNLSLIMEFGTAVCRLFYSFVLIRRDIVKKRNEKKKPAKVVLLILNAKDMVRWSKTEIEHTYSRNLSTKRQFINHINMLYHINKI